MPEKRQGGEDTEMAELRTGQPLVLFGWRRRRASVVIDVINCWAYQAAGQSHEFSTLYPVPLARDPDTLVWLIIYRHYF